MPPESQGHPRLVSSIFYSLLATVFLAPLAFWPTQYFALESVKTLVIGLLTSVSVILVLILALKERSLKLPTKSITWIGVLLTASLVISSVASGHFIKSFFGQGFELGAASFLITLMLAGFVAFSVVARKAEKAVVLYTALVASYLILWIFQMVRLIKPDFLTLGFLATATSTLAGNWYVFGILSAVITLVALTALSVLSLSSRMKIAYWALVVVSVWVLFIVNSYQIWGILALVLLGCAIYLTHERTRGEGSAFTAFVKRIALIPALGFIIATLMMLYGNTIAVPVISRVNAGYAEISLPWQMTMDVAAGQLKNTPLFGIGPNRFGQAYISNKPTIINTTDYWAVEFASGFGLIPTFLVTQGFVGIILNVLLLVFLGILGARSLRGFIKQNGASSSIPENERPYAHFVLLSSYSGAAFVWMISLVYVPTHVAVYVAAIMTGVWLGAAAAYGRLPALTLTRTPGTTSYRALPAFLVLVLVVGIAWGFTYLKNGVALAYFGKGIKEITNQATLNPAMADSHFATALSLNPLDIYWQGRAEANILLANQVVSSVTSTSTASTTEAAGKLATDYINKAMTYATNAVKADSDNYNNYVSEARVAEVASALRLPQSYDAGVAAYAAAISHNPNNPALYLNLARLHASQSQYDKAIQAIGAVLQVKNNYLDAVYLLSQLEAAKGNLPDAITAAQFATQLNPGNALLFFQLGLLQYSQGSYEASAVSFASAVKLQADYANAQYFLGLADARIGNVSGAIEQFTALEKSNPGNQDIATILSTLRSGKSLFAAPQAVAAARPEKKTHLPLPTK